MFISSATVKTAPIYNYSKCYIEVECLLPIIINNQSYPKIDCLFLPFYYQ